MVILYNGVQAEKIFLLGVVKTNLWSWPDLVLSAGTSRISASCNTYKQSDLSDLS